MLSSLMIILGISLVGFSIPVYADISDGTVKSFQKISETEGGFEGPLEPGSCCFGWGLADLGDLDGDGTNDIAVGNPQTGNGEVFILFLNSDGTVKDEQKIADGIGGFDGDLDQDQFGRDLALLGDLDGDGVNDLAVGAVQDDDGRDGFEQANRGAVWILFLNSDGTVKSHQKISDTQGNFTGVLDDSDFFGNGITSIGDLDGDAITDLAVGAPRDDDGGASPDANRGAVWILFLNSDGTVKSHQKISHGPDFGAIFNNNDQFGRSITNLGDVDGNGITDLAVGSTVNDGGGISRGSVWILFMKTDGKVNSFQKISDSRGDLTEGNSGGLIDDGDSFGFSVAGMEDLDMDSIPDLVVGARGDDDDGLNNGAVWVIFLNDDGKVKAKQKISDLEGNFNGILDERDLFGNSVSKIWDIDGNGITDLSVGAIQDPIECWEEPFCGVGATWVIFLREINEPYLSTDDSFGSESIPTIDFILNLSFEPNQTATVNYVTSEGTATSDEDYEEVSGTVSFLAGETSKTVSVPIIDDDFVESDETFVLTLSNCVNCALNSTQVTGIIIANDEIPPLMCGEGTLELDNKCVPDLESICSFKNTVDLENLLCIPDLEEICGEGTIIEGMMCVARTMMASVGGELLAIDSVVLFVAAIGVNPVVTGLVVITLAGVAWQTAWYLNKKKNKT